MMLMDLGYVRNMAPTILLTSCRCIFLLFTLFIAPLLSRLRFISSLLFSLAEDSTEALRNYYLGFYKG